MFEYIWSFLFLQFSRLRVGSIKLAPWLSSAAGAIRWPRLRRHNQGQLFQLTCAEDVSKHYKLPGPKYAIESRLNVFI